MTSPSWELQKALHQHLGADTALQALIAPGGIYDRVPRRAEFPYLTFGPAVARDWSTSTDEGSEHALTLNVWSKGGGAREVHLITAAIARALSDAGLTLSGYRLVNLRHETSDTQRLSDGETYVGTVRLRAVLETI